MLSNTLIMAFRAIRRNATRSFLTILGIVIGVASVVALVTIGEGASQKVASEIGALGENLLTVRPGAHRRPGSPGQAASAFELEDALAIQREISGIDHLAPTASSQKVVVFGNINWSTTVTGTTSSYLDCRGYEIAAGRTFTSVEDDGGRPLCILGATVAKELFATREPIGQRIRLGRLSCTVIGTLKPKGQAAMGMDQDDLVLIPIKAFQRRISGEPSVSSLEISVNRNRTTSVVKTQIESLMRERRGIQPGSADDFHVRDMQEIVSAIQESSSVLTTLLSAIAAVSLLVGGIGIMNIMLVSVTERTREIGIRLAIGATSNEVMLQFLVEAAVLSGFGGLFGLALGNTSAYIATSVLKLPYIPSPLIAAIAFVFSVFVGITFGFLPARKAARLNPMEALRYE